MYTAHPHRAWRFAFVAGDLLLVTIAAAGTALLMKAAHDAVASFWVAALLGMLAGMVASTALAFVVRPLLGSIETTVPVMLAGMLSGMVVCLAMIVSDLG